jgi:hypothetical protein
MLLIEPGLSFSAEQLNVSDASVVTRSKHSRQQSGANTPALELRVNDHFCDERVQVPIRNDACKTDKPA